MRGILVLFLAWLTGCQPLPHPFAEESGTANPLLEVPESYGLVVGDIAGLPGAPDLRRRLANALQDEGVLASTRAGNDRAYRLSGAVDPVRGSRLDWRLQAPDGSLAHRVDDVSLSASASRGFAREIAEALRSSLPEDERSLGEESGQPTGPMLGLAGVDGAPGDGSVALTRALGAALAIRGINVVPEDAARLTVQGTVAVEPLRDGVDRVELVWSVLAPDGQVVGTVEQANEVAAGSLNGRWGSIAEAAAQGAAEGIVGVLEGMHAQALGNG